MTTYSKGYPYPQYIGLVKDHDVYFKNKASPKILINGVDEKNLIYPESISELALDTPCPIIFNNNIYLYFAFMDRSEKIWRTSLAIIDKDFFMTCYEK